MSRFRGNPYYGNGPVASGGAIPSNASFVGAWFWIEDADSIGVSAVLTGTGSPTATWGFDVSDDPDANKKTDAQLVMPPTALTLTTAMIAQNPAGTTANINYLFQFDPSPRAKWGRFKYTVASGGSASPLLQLAVEIRGI